MCNWQVCSSPRLDDSRNTDQDEGVSAGGGDDAETRRPHVQTGDEVPQQAGRVSDGLDHGQLTPAQRSRRRFYHVQVSVC